MARRQTQRRGLFSSIYKPIGKVIRAANSVSTVATKSVKKVVSTGLNTVNRVGKRAAARADTMVGRMMPKKRRATRRRHR
uniref:Uncharacterized protein n=1 Tax=viral metagenome TaxID=1070528 RepID=A0A6C0K104_9ZZZZ